MSIHQDILVFSEKPALLAELIGGALGLAAQTHGEVTALVMGTSADVQRAFTLGAARVLWAGQLPPGRILEDALPTLNAAVQAAQPFALLVGATVRGRLIAGRLAARLGTAALTDALELMVDGAALTVRHMVFGGGAVRVDRCVSPIKIVTVGAGVFEPLPVQNLVQGKIDRIGWVDSPQQAVLVERRERGSSAVNLSAARRVVCPGRGVKQQEDLGMIEQLSAALNAEMACTRPLAEGLNWLPRERYIGISGAMIKPDLYMGIGVSGQAQHTIGMSESRVVVAINKDSTAPLVAQSDYAVAGDLYQVVPALIAALKARKG